MPTLASNSGIRDNDRRGSVADFLRGEICDGSRLSVVSAYFTIYAYDKLKDCLDRIGHLHFLFGESTFVNRRDPSKTEKNAFIIDAAGLELANTLQQKRVAKECVEWIESKVDIRKPWPQPKKCFLYGRGSTAPNVGPANSWSGSTPPFSNRSTS